MCLHRASDERQTDSQSNRLVERVEERSNRRENRRSECRRFFINFHAKIDQYCFLFCGDHSTVKVSPRETREKVGHTRTIRANPRKRLCSLCAASGCRSCWRTAALRTEDRREVADDQFYCQIKMNKSKGFHSKRYHLVNLV